LKFLIDTTGVLSALVSFIHTHTRLLVAIFFKHSTLTATVVCVVLRQELQYSLKRGTPSIFSLSAP